MAIPTVIVVNKTGGAITFTRLGLTVGAGVGVTLNLSLYCWIDEMLQDESLHAAIAAGNVVLNYGNGDLTTGESLKFFNFVSYEVRIPVRVLSTVDVSPISGVSQTLDGSIVIVAEDRVLLTNQAPASENGIWVAKAGAWVRPEDFDVATSASGAQVFIEEGDTHAGEVWNCTNVVGSDIVDTSSLTFAQISGSGGVTSLQTAYNGGATIVTAGAVDIGFTLTAGNFTVDGAGDVIFGGGTALGDFSVDTGTMSLDSTDTTNLTMTANDAGGKTLTIAASNAGAGVGNIAMSADGTFDLQTAGNITIDSSGGTIGIGTDDDDFAINMGTVGERQITIGNNVGVTGVAIETGTGDLLIDAPLTTLTGNLLVEGTTTTIHSEIVNVADNFLYLNADYTTAAAMAGGIVVNNLPTTFKTDVAATGFVARLAGANAYVYVADAITAIAAGSDTDVLPQATINVDDTTGFPASGTIYITDTNGVEAITYTGVTGTSFTGCSGGTGTLATGDLVSMSATALPTAGDFVQVSGADDQTNDGLYEVLTNLNGVLTIKGLGTTPGTYEFTQNDFATSTVVAGEIRVVTVGTVQVDTSGDLQYGYGSDSSLTFYDLITSLTLTLQGAYDGGQTITTAGGNPVLIAGSEELQVTATGGINLDTIFDADVTVFDVQMTGTNGFSIDGTATSNIGVAAGDLDLATTTSGSIHLDGIDGVYVESASGPITIGGDDIDEAINVGTLGERLVTVGNNQGATGVVVNSGTEMVVVDGVTYYGKNAGAPTATVAGLLDGDKYYDTDLDMEMRYDATRAKWLSVEAMYLQFGRNGFTAVDQYYRGIDGRVMSAALGYYMPHLGSVVGMGYTRSDSDAATFDIMADGVSIETLASAAVQGGDNTMDGDFVAGDVLAVMNQAGGNVTEDVMGWVKCKWRIEP